MSYSLEAIFNSTTWAISKHSGALSELQEQAATGQEINRVSDDPAVASRILSLKADSRTKEQYLNAINDALSTLDFSSASLRGITDAIANMRTKLTQVHTGTMNTSMRDSLATELNGMLDQVVSLANTERLGSSLFGGANADVDPYAVVRDGDGEITSVKYQGSFEERKIDVAPGVEISWVLSGESLFKSDSTRSYSFNGSTGAAAGSGTSSARGDVMLTVTDAGGGLYDLSIDGGTTTVTTTGVAANDANIPVVNAATGEVLYVDATGIATTGTEPIRVEGTYDIFNILINTRDMLRNSNNLSDDEVNAMLDATVSSLQNVNQNLVKAYPLVGGRISTLTSLRDSMEDAKFESDEEVNRLQDADITQIAVQLAKHEVLYEMSLSVAAKMFSMSLLDFMV